MVSHMAWQLRYRSLWPFDVKFVYIACVAHTHTRTHISFVEQNEVQKWSVHVTCECSCFFCCAPLLLESNRTLFHLAARPRSEVESEEKQKINEIPKRHRYTRDGDWRGSPPSKWTETMSWNRSNGKINSIKDSHIEFWVAFDCICCYPCH